MMRQASLPRRSRLTISNGEAKPMLRIAENDVARTWLAIVPLESHCFAVRLGFANPFDKPMEIVGVSIQPACSYNPVPGGIVAGTSTGHATGGAPRSTVYFDDGGRDGQRINTAGTMRGITLLGPAGNDGGGPYPFVINWSDWASIRSIPRRDGGQNPLLYVYVALRAGPMATTGFVPDPFQYAASLGCRGRVPVNLRSELSGDWTGNPDGTSWGGAIRAPAGNGSQAGYGPLVCLQYMSVIPGFQGIVSGDSLMAGPAGAGAAFAGAAIRAGYDLSALSDPICIAHMACGGAGSAVYHDCLTRNIDAIRPSFLVLQPLSRNDGMAGPNLAALFAKLAAAGVMAEAKFGTRTIYQGAYPIPSVDPRNGGTTSQVEAWEKVRADLRRPPTDVATAYDGASVIGDAAAPWLYRAGCSDDNTHPNDKGVELVTPLVRHMLQTLIGQ
jgi:hypothetical protein